MLHNTIPVLFESTAHLAVVQNPVNSGWVALLGAICGDRFETLVRRYYVALCHFRKQRARPALPGQIEIEAKGKQQALQGILEVWERRKDTSKDELSEADTFVDAMPTRTNDDLPEVLRDLSNRPPPLSSLLGGAGRPPCDAMCLMKAFLAAPLFGIGDGPCSVHRLLHGNPTFATMCGFLGRHAMKQPGELTSRRLPSLSVCEEFSEVMTRYGLWHLARVDQVRHNIATGVVKVENTACFDTTHVNSNSHCDNVVPSNAQTEEGKRPKHRKVPRMRKRCGCDQQERKNCEHPWVPTDQGAAVVVKGSTRVHWAHKASVASFASSEVPFDIRVCQYAATNDGKTLIPHLEALARDFPSVVLAMQYILADDAYRHNRDAVKERLGQKVRLVVPVHGRKAREGLAQQFTGIDRFTPAGVPICEEGHLFQLRGRDIIQERYIWGAPDDDEGRSVCEGCPRAAGCLKRGQRRQIRVDRRDQPQIDWEHPQHFAKERARYARRTGVERAIKRVKVDLRGEVLTHRDGLRVQAHFDRKLLTLHLLLELAAPS